MEGSGSTGANFGSTRWHSSEISGLCPLEKGKATRFMFGSRCPVMLNFPQWP